VPARPSADAKPAKAAAPATNKNSPAAIARLIVEVVAIFLVVRTLFIAGYRIPSGSMEPTLLVGDWLFVTPLPFGPHIPLTSWNLPGFMDPKRGTINIYESPPQHYSPATPYFYRDDSTPTIVKRIAAVPGDTIHMRKGVFYVNGTEQHVLDLPLRDSVQGSQADAVFAWQRKYELANTRFGAPPATITHDDWGPLLVPPKSYFSLGDNRYNSIDARYYGWIPRKNFRGRPLIIYFSFDTQDLRFRWERMFRWLWNK
jgi:signal peptidase I